MSLAAFLVAPALPKCRETLIYFIPSPSYSSPSSVGDGPGQAVLVGRAPVKIVFIISYAATNSSGNSNPDNALTHMYYTI